MAEQWRGEPLLIRLRPWSRQRVTEALDEVYLRGLICDCPEWPVVLWRFPDGEWLPSVQVEPDRLPLADIDAEAFLLAGCNGVAVGCTSCLTIWLMAV